MDLRDKIFSDNLDDDDFNFEMNGIANCLTMRQAEASDDGSSDGSSDMSSDGSSTIYHTPDIFD